MIIARLQHMRIKYKSPLSSFIPAMCLVAQSCPTLCNSVDYSLSGSSVHGDSPSKNTELVCHVIHQMIISTQELNQGLLHCRQFLYHLSHQGSPYTSSEQVEFETKSIISFLLAPQKWNNWVDNIINMFMMYRRKLLNSGFKNPKTKKLHVYR